MTTMNEESAASSSFVRKDGSETVKCFPEKYDDLFNEKITTLRNLLKWEGNIEKFESPKSHFRMRTNFTLWQDNPKNRTPEGMYYAMFGEGSKREALEITSFPRGSLKINSLMDPLLKGLRESPVLFKGVFEARFVTTQLDEALIALCYKVPINNSEWKAAAEVLAETLKCKIIGYSRKVKVVVGDDDTVKEALTVNGQQFFYYQTEGAFTQPNAKVCEKMLGWASDVTKKCTNKDTDDLLELYCGGGTFTASLSGNFRKVLATEISKSSVLLAQRNFAANNIENIKVARLSSEEFTDAYTNNRPFKRLQEVGISSFSEFNLQTVLVDPPRAGIDTETCHLMSRFSHIVYISCNPITLARDLELLKKTHRVQRVAAFDQFPYTHHLESGVYLVRMSEAEIEMENRASAIAAIVGTIAGETAAAVSNSDNASRNDDRSSSSAAATAAGKIHSLSSELVDMLGPPLMQKVGAEAVASLQEEQEQLGHSSIAQPLGNSNLGGGIQRQLTIPGVDDLGPPVQFLPPSEAISDIGSTGSTVLGLKRQVTYDPTASVSAPPLSGIVVDGVSLNNQSAHAVFDFPMPPEKHPRK